MHDYACMHDCACWQGSDAWESTSKKERSISVHVTYILDGQTFKVQICAHIYL